MEMAGRTFWCSGWKTELWAGVESFRGLGAMPAGWSYVG